MITCSAKLGFGRVKGELIRRNSETIVMKIIPRSTSAGGHRAVMVSDDQRSGIVKRHIIKHRVVIDE